MNQHRIDTIAELVDVVTEDNIEVLAHDIKCFLQAHLEARKGVVTLPNGNSLHFAAGTKVAPSKTLIWNDDDVKGLNKVTIEFKAQ